jgi:Putative beta-barrel porin 2
MTNHKGTKGGFLLFAAVLLWSARFAFGDGAEPLPDGSDSKVALDSKTIPTEELSTGNFSRLPFHVSVSVRGGYDDNITTANFNRQESGFTNGDIAVTYDFGSPRTQLSLQTGGGATYYWDHPTNSFNDQDYDVNAYVAFSLRHKASARLIFDITAYATYQTEPDFTLALGLNRRSDNYFYTQDKFSTTYLWTPRFSTTTSYTFDTIQYDDDSVGLFEDRFENTFGNEFKFLLWPTTTLVAEYRFMLVNYDHEGDPIGPTVTLANGHKFTPMLDRDSTTHFVLGGFDHNFSPRFSASVRGGAEFRDYDDSATIGDETSPYFEATLNYALGKDTSVSWTGRYGIEEGDVLLNPSRDTFRTGLRVKHDFTARISGNLGAYYEHDDYDSVTSQGISSPSFTEEAFDAALTLRYAVNRFFAVEGGYNHTEVWSDLAFREYSRNRYWAGLNFSF